MPWRVWIEPRRHGTFLVRSRNSSGKNGKSQICSSKALANKLKEKWREEYEYNDLGLINPDKALSDIWEEYANELEKSGQFRYLKTQYGVIPKFIEGKRSVKDLTRQAVQDYRTEQINLVKTPTVKSRLRHLSAWLSWCVDKGYIPETPFKRIKIPDYVPQPKYMLDEVFHKLDAVATGDIKLAWRIAHTTGLRQGNIRDLTGDMIEGDIAVIPRTKGKKPIIAPLEKMVLDLLPKPLPKGPLFPRYYGMNGEWALRRDFDRLKKKADVSDVTWHKTRHTFVKDALQSGLTSGEVMGYTGHVSPISMQPYVHFEKERLRERHRLIEERRKNKNDGLVGT